MNIQQKIVVIGGSAAGPKTAARARRLSEESEVTILEKGPDLSMASCGYPYYVGGVFDERKMLLCTPTGVVRDPSFFMNAKGINALTSCEVISIDTENKQVHYRNNKTDEVSSVSYDKLLISTGSTPRIPPVQGTDLDGITTLQSIKDADYLKKIKDDNRVKKAVVIGGGLIGIETAEALELAGIEITIVELMDQILPFLDWEIAKLVENHLKSKGVNVYTETGLDRFIGENGKLTAVKLKSGTEIPCELAVIATGVKPESGLAKNAGISIGEFGGIIVDEYMETSVKDIYAAGDCVEIKHRITETQSYSPMGDLANLQGRIAATNMVKGNVEKYSGTIQTGICKIFDFAAGSTGLNERCAEKSGFEYETVVNASPDKPGFMSGKLLVSKMIVEKSTGRLIGYQCAGPGDVSKQLAQAAIAIRGNLTVCDLKDLDLPYAPPFSLAIDHFIASSHIMENKLKGMLRGITARRLREMKCKNIGNPFILDARGPDEYETMRLGIGEVLIPLGQLRKRLIELPEDKNREIICFCKISLRGYEAALILQSAGYTNVKVLEGGIMAWPFEREK
ncbi:MAG: FAD-dependent oxidoreductase [Deltaproteobacteria bacterium]|nr:FAD-dependent oxidoreductase [Deltaproteobacteria bacterium]